MFQNDLFLRALKGETVERPPVWMMRQAGRYLPDFMKLKAKYDFFTRCQTPELATEITVMPIDQIGVDAAILFSDILVIPQAMDIEVEMRPGVGPWLPNPVNNEKRINEVNIPDVYDRLNYVFEAIKLTKKTLTIVCHLLVLQVHHGQFSAIVFKVKALKILIKPKRFVFQDQI